MILAAREPRATPRRSVHLTSHCPSTAPISSSNRSLTHPAANRYPYTRPWDISAGLLEPGLEVRLRGLQSIRVVRAFAWGFGFLTSDFGVGKSQDLGLQPIMPLDLPVKVRLWELTVYPRSHIRRWLGVTRPAQARM